MDASTPKSPLKIKRFHSKKLNESAVLNSNSTSPLIPYSPRAFDESSPLNYHISEQTKQREACLALQSHIDLILNDINNKNKDQRSCEQKVADSKDYPDKDILFQRINKLSSDINKSEVFNLVFEQILNSPNTFGFPNCLIHLFTQISQYYKGIVILIHFFNLDIINQIPMIVEDVNQRLKYEMAENHLNLIKSQMNSYPSNRLHGNSSYFVHCFLQKLRIC